MAMTRRLFMAACAATAAHAICAEGPLQRAATAALQQPAGARRRYHLSISPEALQADPALIELVKQAGVSDIWVIAFLYGHWHYPLETVVGWRTRIEQAGLSFHILNLPLGHPGDALGSTQGGFPLTPPPRWKQGISADGAAHAGTSLHTPATQENCDALQKLAAAGVKRVFLDDDFRLARGPGDIGGCFCPEHKKRFCDLHGYGDAQWQALLHAVKARDLTPILREWVDFTCDELTESFRAQQAAAPTVQLGNMIMYLGSEKAGIRLADYRDSLFRVGEYMFDDQKFSPIKGKTDELFSCLFHRRYAQPELAFSETTAYPADKLSADNMAAKLAVSTIADVRNTLFMSGVTTFPRTHWATLAPAMKQHAAIHERLAGHAPAGPFKHLWGEHSRFIGDDNPYSLFLALGVPFEVTDKPAPDGWTFLADHDARGIQIPTLPATQFIARPSAKTDGGCRAVPEALPDLFALKHEILPHLANVPYVEQDVPVVCAWYPTARAVLLWNLQEKPVSLTLRKGESKREVAVGALGVTLQEAIY